MEKSPLDFRPGAYLAPRHWPTWLGLGLLRLCVRLPYPAILRLGALLGRVLHYALAQRRRIARANVAACFPDLAPSDQAALVRRHFRAIGISLCESALSWWASDARLAPLAHFTGLEHLAAARARGQGVILVSGHFAAFEIGGRLLNAREPLVFMYKPQRRNPLFDAMTTRLRRRHYRREVPHDDLRAFARALKEGAVCWILPDQDMGRRAGVFAPFMGQPAATVTTPARLSRMTGAAVVPYLPRRRADGRGYDIEILPPLEDYPSGDLARDAARLNAVLEGWAREIPEQYLWVHRRFKTRPPGAAPLYPPRRRR